jgi:NAD(P)-dependent dehydrogenase (short-subunit alcohol dehydrogenase family)
MMTGIIAVVTGANRGIGFEICRQLAKKEIKVILTARNEKRGKEAIDKLKKEGLEIAFHQLDVTDERSIQQAASYVKENFGKVNILINNAGVGADYENHGSNADIEKIKEILEINTFGPLRVFKAFIPIMLESKNGRIINISSEMGALSIIGGGSAGYRISKAALNAVTCILANELQGTNISVNSVAPGWVRTDMGGPGAPRSIAEGADTAVWLATTDNISTGKFFRDRVEINW